MTSHWSGAKVALADIFAGLARMPRAVLSSVNPNTKTEAKIVASQLDLVRSSLRLFDYTLPIAGAVIYFFDQFHDKTAIGLWWSALILTCVANEIFLERNANPSPDPIQSARLRARHKVVICTILTAVWSSIAVLLWSPEFAANQIFVELILCCTLAALATMASLHAASVVGPIVLVSSGVIAVPLVKDVALHPVLVGIAVIYVLMMVWHTCMINMRTLRMLRLENERTDLIENLRKAKSDSDAAHQNALAASRAKSEFLANMSHELRTPLNAIIGFSDIVRTKAFGESAERYSEYGGFIHQSGHHLLNLIGDILDLAKIDAGRKVLHREPVDLASLVSDETARARDLAEAKGIDVIQIVPQPLPLLQADPFAVRQILRNLVSNAVKFTPSGGRVEVSALLNGGLEIELVVSDTGIGIAAAEQAHIFERFGGARPEITTEQRGSGLGLPIVKGLVDMHGAQIALESTHGLGTRVTVTFPSRATLEANRRVA